MNNPRDILLDNIVKNLLTSYSEIPELINKQEYHLPTRECVTALTHELEALLYPGLINTAKMDGGFTYQIGNNVNEAFSKLNDMVYDCLNYAIRCQSLRLKPPHQSTPIREQAQEITYQFFMSFPEIRKLILLDLQAAYQGDPAAKSYAEIILSYPGLRALVIHRMAHVLHNLNVPILPRMMSEYVHNRTGIDIHPAAQIGHSLFIDHGTGVVIGETTIIGNHVKIYQGVTLGAVSIPDPDTEQNIKRHPTIEDDVTIYSGASILGGQTTVGARSVIGSNVWLTKSVPPDTKVLYVPPDLRFKQMEPESFVLQYYI